MFALEEKEYAQALKQLPQIESNANRDAATYRLDALFSTYFVAGVVQIREGHLKDAREQIDRMRALGADQTPLRISLQRWLEGEIALASTDLATAEASFASGEPEFRPYIGQNPSTGDFLRNLPFRDGPARVKIARGDLKGAIDIYRRLLTPADLSVRWPAALEPRFVLALARLLDQTGDRAAARSEYQRFLDLWKRADPELPELTEAKRRLEQK